MVGTKVGLGLIEKSIEMNKIIFYIASGWRFIHSNGALYHKTSSTPTFTHLPPYIAAILLRHKVCKKNRSIKIH